MGVLHLLKLRLTAKERSTKVNIKNQYSTMRVRRKTPCPGTVHNRARLFNERVNIQNPKNVGTCQLGIGAYDSTGELIAHILINPGQEAASFDAPYGTVSMWIVCNENCKGDAELEYDTPINIC